MYRDGAGTAMKPQPQVSPIHEDYEEDFEDYDGSDDDSKQVMQSVIKTFEMVYLRDLFDFHVYYRIFPSDTVYY